MKKFFYNWAPVIVYVAFIYLLSALPLQVTGPSDKIIHFFEYALMGFFVARGLLLSKDFSKWTAILLAGLLATMLGLFDEFHQYFVPTRYASWGDALADALGAFAGAFAYVYSGILLFRSRKLYPKTPGSCG